MKECFNLNPYKDQRVQKSKCIIRLSRLYKDGLKGMQIWLSNSQAGPGKAVKQEQEEISGNHVQALNSQSRSRSARAIFR